MAALACAAAMTVAAGPGTASAAARLPVPNPTVSDFQWLNGGLTPPTQAECNSAVPNKRRCFNPTSMQKSYNLPPLYAAGHEGQGVTVAIIDSFGNPNMASDLANFDTQMGLPHMCGEPGVTCASDMPTFQHEFWPGASRGERANNATSRQPLLEDVFAARPVYWRRLGRCALLPARNAGGVVTWWHVPC
jgi:hypothetical protein